MQLYSLKQSNRWLILYMNSVMLTCQIILNIMHLSLYRYTTKNVSPALQQTELEAVGKTTSTHGNMEVRAYVGVSEVSVIYHLHEFSIELFVRLPANYPLQPPSIREGKRVKVEASQWRKWMLQLNVFVANQV